MAAYPFTTFSKDSVGELNDGREIVRATNGAAKVRQSYPSDKKAFTLLHRLKSAEKTTLSNFYGTNRDITWTLVFDGTTSTCVFAGPPRYQPLPGSLYNVTVRAEEV
jgi:hypothetical protein